MLYVLMAWRITGVREGSRYPEDERLVTHSRKGTHTVMDENDGIMLKKLVDYLAHKELCTRPARIRNGRMPPS